MKWNDDSLDPTKYGPLAVRDQLIAVTACLVQMYGVLIATQMALPADKQAPVQKQMRDLSGKLTDLLKAMDGTNG